MDNIKTQTTTNPTFVQSFLIKYENRVINFLCINYKENSNTELLFFLTYCCQEQIIMEPEREPDYIPYQEVWKFTKQKNESKFLLQEDNTYNKDC